MIQLLVYSALARRQGRAVIMIWTSLAVLVVLALAVDTANSLVLVVVPSTGCCSWPSWRSPCRAGDQR